MYVCVLWTFFILEMERVEGVLRGMLEFGFYFGRGK